jgi:hypothetical protein
MVLLERLAQWEPHVFYQALSVPQQHIICKLLCCSAAMTDLVYRACRGELRASMTFDGFSRQSDDESQVTDSSALPQHVSAGRWLAKHAVLLQELSLAGSRNEAAEIEASIAGGLQAASGRSKAAPEDHVGSSAAPRRGGLGWWQRRAQPAPPALAHQQQQGADSSTPSRLLLKAARFQIASCGSMLCALAGSQQLTALSMNLRQLASVHSWRQCQLGLQSLTSLQDLDLGMSHVSDVSGLLSLAQGLQQLTQLTKLRMRDGSITQGCLSTLPVSLRELWWETSYESDRDVFNFSHLTALSKLNLPRVLLGDVLPPGLHELAVWGCDFGKPLAGLTGLEVFSIVCIPHADVCTQLQGVAALREVRIGCDLGLQFGTDPNVVASELASLPLLEVRLRTNRPLSPGFVFSMRQWTKLKRLDLALVHIDGSFKDLSEQLQRLPELQQLQLDKVTACQGEKWLYRELPVHRIVSDLQAFMRCCGRMPSLYRLHLQNVHVGRALLELVPGPKLAVIVLMGCSVDADTAAAARAKWPGAAQLHISN